MLFPWAISLQILIGQNSTYSVCMEYSIPWLAMMGPSRLNIDQKFTAIEQLSADTGPVHCWKNLWILSWRRWRFQWLETYSVGMLEHLWVASDRKQTLFVPSGTVPYWNFAEVWVELGIWDWAHRIARAVQQLLYPCSWVGSCIFKGGNHFPLGL